MLGAAGARELPRGHCLSAAVARDRHLGVGCLGLSRALRPPVLQWVRAGHRMSRCKVAGLILAYRPPGPWATPYFAVSRRCRVRRVDEADSGVEVQGRQRAMLGAFGVASGCEDCASHMRTEGRQRLEHEFGDGWHDLFWDVFERTLNPIGVLDESRHLVAVNPAAAEALGYRAEELVGKSVEELITSPPPAQRDKEWRHLLQTGEQSGVHTYRRPDGSQVEIDFAIRRVRVKQRTLFVSVVLPHLSALIHTSGEEVEPLTVRERGVVALIARGLTTSRIAEQLFISPETVRTHVGNAMAKLDVHTRAELVAIAFSRGELLDARRAA